VGTPMQQPLNGKGRPRVVVADDHAAVATALCNLLEAEFDVVKVVSDGRSLIAAVEELEPEVVVTDVAMPVLDGVSAAEEIRRRRPAVHVVFVSVLADPEVRERARFAGGVAFISNADAGEKLLPAVRAVLGRPASP
jgi:CheY-like chemotaxis protein